MGGPEFWIPIGVFFATQLMTYGALRQQVKDLYEALMDEKRQREKLEERVREVEFVRASAFAKKVGG